MNTRFEDPLSVLCSTIIVFGGILFIFITALEARTWKRWATDAKERFRTFALTTYVPLIC